MIDDRLKSESAPSRLRCPVCSSTVEMPASQCPHCGVNLSTAYIKADRKRHSRLAPAVRAGIMMLAVVALAGVATVWEPSAEPRPAVRTAAAPPAQAEAGPPPIRMIEGAPPNFWRLAAEHPILLRPYIIVYETRAAIMKVNERLEKRQRLLEEIESLTADLEIREDEDMYSIFVRMPPSLRGQMLREMDSIYGQSHQPQP